MPEADSRRSIIHYGASEFELAASPALAAWTPHSIAVAAPDRTARRSIGDRDMDTADERSGVDSADGCATKDCTGIMKRAATLLTKAGRAQTDVHVGRRVLHAVTSRRVQRLTCSRLVGSGRARFAHPRAQASASFI